ncbi:MAG: selenocysteine-specific translation elongation factor, partial [Solirubrobacterales bacterium]
HIDHGKTSLIRALTGVDTDRLPQERARGISIELGYAKLELPSGRALSVIDAPGHERFVRTMVAGATGIDLYLMTIAADDGVMPQTREHAAVLRALAVTRGVVAVTKRDLAEPELAIAEASELLPESEVVAVCARTGAGLGDLRAALDRVAAAVRSRADDAGAARLHVDRVFTIRGAGTVITGTLWSGALGRGDEVVLLPGGTRARVRGVQVHDAPLERARAGQRVAVNLSGVAVSEVARGVVLVSTGSDLRETHVLEADLDAVVEQGVRVQVHHGTRESPARLRRRGERWRIELERAVAAVAGDRLVIRRIAPPDTLGGGVVLDPHPPKHDRKHDRGREGTRSAKPGPGPEGPARESRASSPPQRALPSAAELALECRLRDAGLEPPSDAEFDPDQLAALRLAGRAIRVAKALHYHPEVLLDVQRRVIALAERRGGAVTLAQVRDELGTSRKFAQALLEHLDSEKVTIRRGDEHVLRRAARGVARASSETPEDQEPVG